MTEWKYERETKTIRTVPGNHWIASMDSWDSAVDNEVNAAFIVKACNNHDELLTALKETRAAMDGLAKLVRDNANELCASNEFLLCSSAEMTCRNVLAKTERT